MATLFDKHITGDSTTAGFSSAVWRAQTFTVANAFTITGVKLKLYYTGAVPTIQVSIRATDVSSHPTGGDLCVSAEIVGTDFEAASPGDWVWIPFTSNADLTAGIKYAIVCRVTAGGDCDWRLDNVGGGVYAGGSRENGATAGTVWTTDAAYDYMFACYGGAGIGAATAPVDKTYSRQLVSFCNNEVWRTAVAGTMSEVADANGDIDTTLPLSVAEAFQKLFIVNGTNFKVLDFVNTKITTADIDPGGAADGPPDFGAVLTGGTSGAKMIVDYITAIDGACVVYGKRTTTATFADTEVVTGTNASTSPYYGAAGGISFTLNADEVSGPHWYDWTVFGADATNYGAMPDSAYGVCRYRGRLQITVDPNYPHQWYQTRQKNPFDFLYATGDAQSPVAGNDADCGEVGDIIKVAIPYHDDYLIYGCANEIWYLSGDAAYGGELNILLENAGILGAKAWCWDDNKNLYLLCTSGLFRIPVGFQTAENLTKEIWPDFITDLAFNSSTHRIVLAYSPEDHGIHIFKTTLATGACSAWWYDLRVEGMFPDAIPTAMGIYCAFYYQTANPTYRKALVGCADGYIKSFDSSQKDDDGTAINSYVGFAPLKLSLHSRKDGIIRNINLITSGGASGGSQTDSSDVLCSVHVARTAEKIIEKLDGAETAAFTKTFTAPGYQRGNIDRRQIRGQWCGVVLSNSTADQSWSMERLMVDVKEAGRSL